MIIVQNNSFQSATGILGKYLLSFHLFIIFKCIKGRPQNSNPGKTLGNLPTGGRGCQILPGFPNFEVLSSEELIKYVHCSVDAPTPQGLQRINIHVS